MSWDTVVIVESPAKAKTINRYLGSDYKVEASFGHVRQLPSKKGSVIPEDNFHMIYETDENSDKQLAKIIKALKGAKKLVLATDPDREGEAISWHIVDELKNRNILKKDMKIERVTFNEITKKAIQTAIKQPKAINSNLVHAQQARQALDYLVGFNLSPVLWSKLPGSRSAGRVQSMALRVVCDREIERDKFITQEFWEIFLHFTKAKVTLETKLVKADGKELEKFSITSQEQAANIIEVAQQKNYNVDNIIEKERSVNPPAPFITSSLQQAASTFLGISPRKTMSIAQSLYEGVMINGENIGLITYMRTDGTSLADDAVGDIRRYIEKEHPEILPSKANIYKSKVKNAQEAHEAIRPTDVMLTPEKVKSFLDTEQFKLYKLIWDRTVACQCKPAIFAQTIIEITSEDDLYQAKTTLSQLKFAGFKEIWGLEPASEEATIKGQLALKKNDKVELKEITPKQNFTNPPPRFSEASLIAELERLGVGRPSTYASIISVLIERQYVNLVKRSLIPSERGRLVSVFLGKFFSRYVEPEFTAKLEDGLDEISNGDLDMHLFLKSFWQPFHENVEEVKKHDMVSVLKDIEHLLGVDKQSCPKCSSPLTLRIGSKFGSFIGCSGYPECNYISQVFPEKDGESESSSTNIFQAKIIGKSLSGEEILLKKGPYGLYLEVGEEGFEDEAPKKGRAKKGETKALPKVKRASVPSWISIDNLNEESANNLLSLPKVIGNHPKTGEEMKLGISRFGPYILYEKKFYSVKPNEYDIFNLTPTQAEAIIIEKGNKPATSRFSRKKKEDFESEPQKARKSPSKAPAKRVSKK